MMRSERWGNEPGRPALPRRLNGLTAGEVLEQMRALWRQIEAVRAQYDVRDVRGTGLSPEAVANLQQLYIAYQTLNDDYDMLTGQAPTNLAAEQAMNDGAPAFFSHPDHSLTIDFADDAAYNATITARDGRHTVTIPVDDSMMAAALLLDRLLTQEQHDRLWEAMLHIVSMRQTVEANTEAVITTDAAGEGESKA